MSKHAASLPDRMAPGNYVEKVSLLTGETVEEQIRPHQLLVHSHRDYHVIDVQARWLMSRMVEAMRDEEAVVLLMKDARQLGLGTSDLLAKAIGEDASKKLARKLFGLKNREYFFRYKRNVLPKEQIEQRLEALKEQAKRKFLAATGEDATPNLRVLLTGGTGFVGKEIIAQAAQDPAIKELIVVIRPQEVKDRKTGKVTKVVSPAERGAALLRQLWLDGAAAAKIRFLAGDIEQPNLGIAEAEIPALARTVTHVIHSAASVSFDDPYEASFVANVDGSINALNFSERLQSTPGSPFVAHVAIETSYIHGRQTREPAREDEVVFPRNFYNNYYELTKAIGSIETERYMLERGLRVVELCPSIVIGQARTGMNRGDTKVVNAPVNIFGRVRETMDNKAGSWKDRSKAQILARMACAFPGDPSAELNIIPVDWVVRGVVAALKRPEAVGERIHLATDRRLTSDEMRRIVLEELDVEVRLSEPTLHRNVTLPVMGRILRAAGQERVANGLEKLGQIFGGYSEWGQPIHQVGNDHRHLGLPVERPDTQQAFRMLCRHNRWVQHFGQIRDLDEISRREKVWLEMIDAIENDTGRPVGGLSPAEFRKEMTQRIDLEQFVPISEATRRSAAPRRDASEEPLGAVDTAWLQVDQPKNRMIINAMVLFDGELDVAKFRRRVEEGLLSFERFRRRVVIPPDGGMPSWQLDPDFDLNHHFFEHRIEGGDAALNRLIDRLVCEGLDMNRPPWQLHVVRREEGSALVVRVHHCVGDGAAIVYALLSLTDAAAVESEASPAEFDPTGPERRGSLARLVRRIRRSRIALHTKVESLLDPKATFDVAKAGVASAASLGRLILMSSDPDSALRGELGMVKKVAWSRGLPLPEVKKIGKALGATVNDVLMAALTGAIRTYLQVRGDDYPESLRAIIPVNLRPPGETPGFDNRFGLVFLPLPLRHEHELERLDAIRLAMNELKKSPEAFLSLKALDGLGRLEQAIENNAIDIFTGKATVVASNVPGPFERLHVNGVPVKSCVFWVPQSGRIGVGVSILSYSGEVRVGVLADAGLVPDPHAIFTAFEQEVAHLGAGLSPERESASDGRLSG